MHLLYVRKDKKPAIQNAQNCSTTTAVDSARLPADGILVMEGREHIGFLTSDFQHTLLEIPYDQAKMINGREINLEKVGETPQGWELFILPPEPIEWFDGLEDALEEDLKIYEGMYYMPNMEMLSLNIRGHGAAYSAKAFSVYHVLGYPAWVFCYHIERLVELLVNDDSTALAAHAILSTMAKHFNVRTEDIVTSPFTFSFWAKGWTNPYFLHKVSRQFGESIEPFVNELEWLEVSK